MKLQRRIIATVGGALAVTMATLFFAGTAPIVTGLRKIENAQARQDLDRARDAFVFAGEDLATKLSDWSNWDDCHRFAVDRNHEFIKSNLQPEALDLLKIDAIVIVDAAGRSVVGLTRDQEDLDLDQSFPGIAARLKVRDSFFTHPTQTSVKSGLIEVPEGLFLGASRPILDSTSHGPVHGVIAFLKRVDTEFVGELGRRLRSELTLYPLHAPLPPEEQAAAEALIQSGDAWLCITDDQRIHARTLLRDIDDRPMAVLAHHSPRTVFQHGSRSLIFFVVALAIAAVTSIVATILVVQRIIVARIGRLQGQIQRIQQSGDGDARVTCEGRDELSQLGEAMNDLLAANQRAQLAVQESSRAKSDFVASLSHEIRTPMTAILGYADLLSHESEHGLDQNRRAESLSAIQRNGEHLLALLNDVLDISKIEAGCMLVESVECDPIQIVRDVQSLLFGKAAASGVALAVSTKGPLPTVILSDPLRLRQILVNLAGNAIKFTPRGRVCIQASFTPEPRPRMRFEVTDTGIGMSETQLASLFADFAQADRSIARRFGGTGLGLSISRRLARMLGGDIEVKSRLGEGSTFTVLVDAPLPPHAQVIEPAAVEPAVPTAAPAPPLTSGGELAGLAILLAEDNPDNQRLIAFHLKKAGAAVIIVDNGKSAVEGVLSAKSAGTAFDLVLMDMQMPELDGFEATRALRAAGVKTPIVALTAHALAEDRQRCLNAGCDDHAAKPIDRARLIAICVRLTRTTGPIAAKAA